ncbi:hypothetical protein [Umboniibacter marinipuniceus]|uniref:Uncharacterized protein n=1 Tax=Umboniibacter marinipuniceus TaxID=569599 RepID=A0A3M0AJ59_9GAMM|nr:hypothetical protein [Umboniibacter marinipuniceus]RMA82748.1 hypothetical protein DFR27_0706 [Umboniibacter marinipuniceus]
MNKLQSLAVSLISFCVISCAHARIGSVDLTTAYVNCDDCSPLQVTNKANAEAPYYGFVIVIDAVNFEMYKYRRLFGGSVVPVEWTQEQNNALAAYKNAYGPFVDFFSNLPAFFLVDGSFVADESAAYTYTTPNIYTLAPTSGYGYGVCTGIDATAEPGTVDHRGDVRNPNSWNAYNFLTNSSIRSKVETDMSLNISGYGDAIISSAVGAISNLQVVGILANPEMLASYSTNSYYFPDGSRVNLRWNMDLQRMAYVPGTAYNCGGDNISDPGTNGEENVVYDFENLMALDQHVWFALYNGYQLNNPQRIRQHVDTEWFYRVDFENRIILDFCRRDKYRGAQDETGCTVLNIHF